MYVDIKVTVWERLMLDKDQVKIVEKAIAEGKLTSESDLAELGVEGSWETMFETEEVMTPEDNDGQATLEVYSTNGQLFYSNGK